MIYVDPREGSKKYIGAIQRLVTCPVKEHLIEGGDVVFEGNGPSGSVTVGIELKELSDMLNSMRYGRLVGEQLLKMQDQGCQFIYVIYYGIYKADSSGNLIIPKRASGGKTKWETLDVAERAGKTPITFKYAELDKFINTLEVQKNVIIKRAPSEDEIPHMVANLYQWWQKDWDAHESADSLKLHQGFLFTRMSLLRAIAKELPGVGQTLSATVEKYFRSVHEMINASEEMWTEALGNRGATAKKIWAAIRKRI